jgi:hypothetical protein
LIISEKVNNQTIAHVTAPDFECREAGSVRQFRNDELGWFVTNEVRWLTYGF